MTIKLHLFAARNLLRPSSKAHRLLHQQHVLCKSPHFKSEKNTSLLKEVEEVAAESGVLSPMPFVFWKPGVLKEIHQRAFDLALAASTTPIPENAVFLLLGGNGPTHRYTKSPRRVQLEEAKRIRLRESRVDELREEQMLLKEYVTCRTNLAINICRSFLGIILRFLKFKKLLR